MSNDLVNLYIESGQPEGDGLTLYEVAEWGADEIKRLRAALQEIADYPLTQIPAFSRNSYEAQEMRDLQTLEHRLRSPLQEIAEKALNDSQQRTGNNDG